jgi:hypothetical protein
MKYRIIRNWIESAELLTRKSYIVIPFLIWGLLEAVALECIYFFPGVPFGKFINPIVIKFYGEQYIHYPGNLAILPRLFSRTEQLIFILVGAFAVAVAIDLVVRVSRNIPRKPKDIVEDSLRRYISCFVYAILVVAAGIALKRYHPLVFEKTVQPLFKYLPQGALRTTPFAFLVSLLISRTIIKVFLILTIPLIVIKKRFLIIALFESIGNGLYHFFSLFILLLVPYLLYMPVLLLKSYQDKLVSMTFPEIVFHLTIVNIFVLKIVECFIIVCVTRFLLEKQGLLKAE